MFNLPMSLRVSVNSPSVPCTRAVRAVRCRALATDTPTKTTEPLRQLEDLRVVRGLPFLGKMLEFYTPEYSNSLPQVFDEVGEHFMIDMGPLGLQLCTRTGSDIEHMLSNSEYFVMKWPASTTKLTSASGKFMDNAEAKPWRSALQRAISKDTVNTLHLPLMVESFTSIIRKYAQSGEEVLWRTATQKMAFGVACRGILGDKFTEEDLEYMFPLLISISSALFASDFGTKEGVPGTAFWRGIKARKELIRFFSAKLEKILEDRAELEASRTIIGRLLTCMVEEGVFHPSTTNKEIAQNLAGEIVFLQFAGTDTTSYALTRGALLLAEHPQWHDALWEEQQALIEEFGDTIDRRVISRSHIAVAMAQESLRVKASVATVPRTAVKDARVGNIEVPKGTTVICAVQASGQKTGSGSPTYDPAQWLNEDRTKVTLNKDPGNLPFGKGARNCVGQNLANVEMILIFVLLAREVREVVVSEEEIMRPFTAVTHSTGCPLKLVART